MITRRLAIIPSALICAIAAGALAACYEPEIGEIPIESMPGTPAAGTAAVPATDGASPAATGAAGDSPGAATEAVTGAAAHGNPAIEISMIGTAYNASQIGAIAGEPLVIHLRNEGVVAHDFSIAEISVSNVELEGGTRVEEESGAAIHVRLEPGEEAKLTFTPNQPGSYAFYCLQPGHREAGMEATLVVT